MKVNASASYGDYYTFVEIEYEAEKGKEFEQANHFVSMMFGEPNYLTMDIEDVDKALAERVEKYRKEPVRIIKD